MVMDYDLSHDALLHPQRRAVFQGVIPAIEEQPQEFSRNTALFLSHASHLAYYDEDDIAETLPRVGLELSTFFSAESTHAYLAIGNRHAILAFRGTEPDEWEDIKTDGDFRLAPLSGAEVHSGFLEALDLIWPDIATLLGTIEKPVLFTGHSLGGALAVLAASQGSPAAVYTYGAPKVGTSSFQALVQGIPILRVENCCDIVPNLPPELLGYRHVGDQFFLTDDGSILKGPPMTTILQHHSRAELRYTAELALFDSEKALNRWMVDHAIPNYTRAIQRLSETALRGDNEKSLVQ